MFDQFFEFKYINHQPGTQSDGFIRVHTYKFTAQNEPYIFRAEEYQHSVFAVKFYHKSFEDSPQRYNLLTNKGIPSPIFRTCINIMLDIVQKFPTASLGFIGSELQAEGRTNTQRYRIYKQLMENFFSPAKFSHHIYPPHSAYLLINRAQEDAEILFKVESLFQEIYDFGSKPGE
ncbi:MAG: hypothetical protein R3C61_16960 [Bacteroidia bacterium]